MNVIKKPRKPSIKLRQLEAILRRLNTNHPRRKDVEEDFFKARAGYKGEQQLDYDLSFLRDHEFLILSDLRLPHQDKYFQLDSLLISPTFFLHIDAKHLSGKIEIEHTLGQMKRIRLNNEEDVYSDPTLQIKRHELQLREWMQVNKHPLLPFESLVVFTHPNAYVKISNGHPYRRRIIKNSLVTDRINELQEKFHHALFSKKELQRISRQLIKQHTPPWEDLLSKYRIKTDDILTGVICPECGVTPMIRMHSKWLCHNTSCNFSNRKCHLAALTDYALIFGPSITNPQLRKFLHIASVYTANRILTSLKYLYAGEGPHRVYHLPLE
ncbi:nuclease-related domain-containing protein [Evansella clarkii]|uniref:nuclease-related domain-containing protein n=1 Tax=Evansella clarkii TaxID=79879 RepID=UPI000B43DB92|nr:nuclease-related domain-containing protein [Evansella clarkii]